jgi:hypothetical protein
MGPRSLPILFAIAGWLGCEADVQEPGVGGAPPSSTTMTVGSSSSGLGGADPIGPCPARLPGNGEACSPVETLCTYGDTTFPFCRDRAWCQSSGWHVSTPEADCDLVDAACPDPTELPVPHTTCPVEGIQCAFADGAQCSCTFCDTGLPCGAPGPRWACGAPEAGCPLIPPNAGTPCSEPEQSCAYGYLCEGGTVTVCESSGFWIWNQGCTVG